MAASRRKRRRMNCLRQHSASRLKLWAPTAKCRIWRVQSRNDGQRGRVSQGGRAVADGCRKRYAGSRNQIKGMNEIR